VDAVVLNRKSHGKIFAFKITSFPIAFVTVEMAALSVTAGMPEALILLELF